MIIVKIQGGLGNQLFQYAAGRALSLRLKTDLKLDLTFFDNPKFTVALRLHRFDLPYNPAKESEWINIVNKKSFLSDYVNKVGVKVFPFYKENHLIEKDVLKVLAGRYDNDDYYVEGWLADERYFKDYRTTILNDYNMNRLLKGKNHQILEEILAFNSVSVHIRRGEYLSNNYFYNLTKDYYLDAIRKITEKVENPVFFFFSDDIDWVKTEFSSISGARFVDHNSSVESVYTTTGDIEDLMLMRSCKHQIIANSTFSWWGAWLNENPTKIVLSPGKWYKNTAAQKKFEKNSFIPVEWEKVS